MCLLSVVRAPPTQLSIIAKIPNERVSSFKFQTDNEAHFFCSNAGTLHKLLVTQTAGVSYCWQPFPHFEM